MDLGAECYRRYLDGEDKALKDIIDGYFDGLILYLNTIVSNITVAEELAEDTIVKLAAKKPHFNGRASFKTWLYTIGRNIAFDYLRKNKKAPLPLDEAPAQDEISLENDYIRRENKLALHKSLKKLSESHRQVLWLIYFEDMSAAQAAQIMGRSLRATQSLLQRAKEALKTQLEKDGFEYENA